MKRYEISEKNEIGKKRPRGSKAMIQSCFNLSRTFDMWKTKKQSPLQMAASHCMMFARRTHSPKGLAMVSVWDTAWDHRIMFSYVFEVLSGSIFKDVRALPSSQVGMIIQGGHDVLSCYASMFHCHGLLLFMPPFHPLKPSLAWRSSLMSL